MLLCTAILVIARTVGGQQTIVGSSSMSSFLSEFAPPSEGDNGNMIGQVWKRVQEQLAAATRQEENERKEKEAKSSPKHTKFSVATKRKAILDFYAERIHNTTHFRPEHMADAYANASHHRFTTQLPSFPDAAADRELIREMFMHSYDSYMYHAFPKGQEVKPLSCTPGRFSLVELPALTLLDALDTLLLLGNTTEFARSVERLRILDESIIFAVDQNVSVFETNIRVLGGLLSAHQLAQAYFVEQTVARPLQAHVMDASGNVLIGPVPNSTTSSEQWHYDGLLLELATDIADRLLPAFRTETGIPYGTVNLLDGVPRGETKIASLAGAGTLSIELSLLSALTGNPEYAARGKLATRALFHRRHEDTHLLGKHINTGSGMWTESTSGIGSNSDSFYEYLAKHSFLFGSDDTDFWTMFIATYAGVHAYLINGDWYSNADMSFRQRGKGVLESLAAFFPGLQASLGEIVPAASSMNQFTAVRESVGVLPERFSFATSSVLGNGYYPLRPELLESIYHMHRATKEPGWQWAAHTALQHLHRVHRAPCGYAAVHGVHDTTTGDINASPGSVQQIDEMPSFFLSETLKYLYLTFDDDNFLHTDKNHEWIFTTEAHPVHNNVAASEYSPDFDTVREILKNRLDNKTARVATHSQRWKNERWAEKTTQRQFRNDIDAIEKAGWNVTEVFAPVGLGRAYRILGSQGRVLRAACPNLLHNPSTLWTRALLGGSVDYTVATEFDVYSSPIYEPSVALGLLGQNPNNFVSCSLNQDETNQEKKEPTSLSNMFDVSSFGEGIHVANKQSGEKITALIVNNDILLGEESSIGIVYTETKVEQNDLPVADSLSIFDFNNNAVSCRIEVLSTTDDTTVLLDIPCCPALFGPSAPSHVLAITENVVIESTLVLGPESNIYGCQRQTRRDFQTTLDNYDDFATCPTSIARLALRGECSFFTKAVNAADSAVLIVVDQAGDGLFMMSATEDEAMQPDVPFSVLITSGYGLALEDTLKEISEAKVRVHLKPSTTAVDSDGTIDFYADSGFAWPVVGGDGNVLHVLTGSGWGIRGVWNPAGTWEVKLVKHG